MQDLLRQVVNIAHEASDVIMSYYDGCYNIDFKKDSSPVTQADLAAHHVILKGLKALDARYPILSEEGAEGLEHWKQGERYWLVDPLDGTKEFIRRNGEFTVNIALIENGKALLGVVVAPALQVAYAAAKGQGAFKIDSRGDVQRIGVAGRERGAQGLRVLSSRHHHTPELTQWLSQLPAYELSPMGSSIKLCLIAEGKADVYPRFGPTCLWDTAAAHAIVEEAGGSVEAMSGGDIHYDDPHHTLNPPFVVRGCSLNA